MKNLYNPSSEKPFKLSRSKIELFFQCPRCFYLDRRLGVERPSGPPFTLNMAVDKLLKQEFDMHRAHNTQHSLLQKYGIDARPVVHENLAIWRNNFKGVNYLHPETNLQIFGAIDDLWQNSKGEYLVVDFKATSKVEDIVELNQTWHEAYKRQMEIYQWLLRKNGLLVSNTGYFVYCNGKSDREAFDGKLEFDVTLIAYVGHDGWIEKKIAEIYACLHSSHIPAPDEKCEFCNYRRSVRLAEEYEE